MDRKRRTQVGAYIATVYLEFLVWGPHWSLSKMTKSDILIGRYHAREKVKGLAELIQALSGLAYPEGPSTNTMRTLGFYKGVIFLLSLLLFCLRPSTPYLWTCTLRDIGLRAL